MSLRDGVQNALSHSMRAYYLPLAAGLVLAGSAFMPWTIMGDRRLGGVPDVAGLWVLGLGGLAVVLASLSVITWKNSRHPLLLVGLAAFAILWVNEGLLERAVADQAWAHSQAQAIVRGRSVDELPAPTLGFRPPLSLRASV